MEITLVVITFAIVFIWLTVLTTVVGYQHQDMDKQYWELRKKIIEESNPVSTSMALMDLKIRMGRVEKSIEPEAVTQARKTLEEYKHPR
jgi:E3 ubiquitin-protein ligase DOA10